MKKKVFKFLELFFLLFIQVFIGCNNLLDAMGMGGEDEPSFDPNSAVRSVVLYNVQNNITYATNKEGQEKLTVLNINQDESVFLQLKIDPAEYQGQVHVDWEYDEELLSCTKDNYGLVITGKKGGGGWVKCTVNRIVATVLISVIPPGDTLEHPYIFSSTSVVQVKVGDSVSIQSSLYGGSVADMEHFVWSIADPSKADIASARNNCLITAKLPGTTQITCSHPNAKYPYTFVLFVYTESMEIPYITTTTNVITIDRNTNPTANVTVELRNAYSNSNRSFHWGFDDGDAESGEIVTVTGNGTSATIEGKKSGVAKIKVTNEQAEYPLYIYVRVVSIVQNVYIKLSEQTVVMDGSEKPVTIYAELINLPEGTMYDTEKFEWEVESADGKNDPSVCMDWTPSGNSLRIDGKKNGKFKISCRHELSEVSKSCFIILTKQDGSKINSAMYISTTDNYVQTKVGAEPFNITFRLAGGDDSDTADFRFYIKGGRNGADNGIATVTDSYGNLFDMTTYKKPDSSRAVATVSGSADVTLSIKPEKQGEIIIYAQHPRCLYECESKIKVFSEYALLEEPVKVSYGEKVIYLANTGDSDRSKTITANLLNAATGDENGICWKTDDESKVILNPVTGASTTVTAKGSGTTQSYISAEHEKAEAPLRILVVQSSTVEEAQKAVFIYAPTTYYRVASGKDIDIEVLGNNVTGDEYRVEWKTDNFERASVSVKDGYNGMKASLRGGNVFGKALITATLLKSGVKTGEDVIINVMCVPEGEESVLKDPVFLTTTRNAVVFTEPGDSDTLSIMCNNMPPEQIVNTNWDCKDITEPAVTGKPIFELHGSGSSASIQAVQKGKSEIVVSNDAAQNSLTISAKCGEVYEWTEEAYSYIVCENGEDVVNIKNGESSSFVCSLAGTSTDSFMADWTFTVTKGQQFIDAVGFGNGKCTVKGKEPGQAIITVKCNKADFPKDILVNIANSDEELHGFKYLSTETNVVSVSLGSSKEVSVKLMNSESDVFTGYTWSCDNPGIVRLDSTGVTCVLTALKPGTTRVTVTNVESLVPLEIIVMVVDPVLAAADPYISCANIVECSVGGDKKEITAELIGGNEADKTKFSWTVEDPTVIQMYGVNDSCVITPLKEGMTSITLRHPKANVERRILVICDARRTTNYYITTDKSVLKLSPSDSETTVTATLINGDEGDAYNFKWWADNYEYIDMNSSGASCVIKPVSNGSVNIHVSHPKCSEEKIVQVYISQYEVFAFEQPSITIVGGNPVMVAMEVPTMYKDCTVAYRSDNGNVCSAWGNNNVCNLSPRAKGQTTIIAELKDKGGSVKATAKLIAVVEEDTEDINWLSYNGSTIITLNKGDKINLNVNINGKNLRDTNGSNIKWTIKNRNVIDFTTSRDFGTYTEIQALRAGEKTTITISHDECPSLTLYVIVPGKEDAQITLSESSKTLYLGERSWSLTAKVQNDVGEAIEWVVEPSDQDVIEYNAKLKGCSIKPKNLGKVTVTARLPSTGIFDKCDIEVKETEKLTFFVFDDEGKECEVTTQNVYPGEDRLIYYRTIPAGDKITRGTFETNGVFDIINLGYKKDLSKADENIRNMALRMKKDFDKTPDDAGALIIEGKSIESNKSFWWRGETTHYAENTLNIVNSYNYYFAVDKNSVSVHPDEAEGKFIELTYHVRPATAYVVVDRGEKSTYDQTSPSKKKELSRLSFYDRNGKLCDTSGAFVHKIDSTLSDSGNLWAEGAIVYDQNNIDYVDKTTSIGTGKIRFKVTGEAYEMIRLIAKNKPIASTSDNINRNWIAVGADKNVSVDVTYGSRNFSVKVTGDATDTTGIALPDGGFVKPRFDKQTGAIFIPMTNKKGQTRGNNNTRYGSTNGDVTVEFTVDNIKNKNAFIYGAAVGDPDSSDDNMINEQISQCDINVNHVKNTFSVTIPHSKITVNDGYNEKLSEAVPTRVKAHLYVGLLKVTYWLYDGNDESSRGRYYKEIKVPVYAEKLE